MTHLEVPEPAISPRTEAAPPPRSDEGCESISADALAARTPIIASNRGPVTFRLDGNGNRETQRGGGGLVTALMGVVQQTQVRWISCAQTPEDREWGQGLVEIGENGQQAFLEFVKPSLEAYQGFYHTIANPLLWFLQHSMWDMFREPTIDRVILKKWEEGYVPVNMLFAEAISKQIQAAPTPALVMLQDYHLYLTPGYIRRKLRPRARYALTHFIHIPWPGSEDWKFLPPWMRTPILESLCAVDLLGFQTREDGLNFLRTCESLLPRAHVSYKHGRVWYRNHATHVREFPISIDVRGMRALADGPEVERYRQELERSQRDRKLILRIDRMEPTKNIVRGFQAYDDLLEHHPEHRGNVRFLALLVPSRLKVREYGTYLDEVMAAAGRVNARYGDAEWEPIRILVGEEYPRAVAGLQIYDVLLVNSIADGMNLVAKEGPIVNRKAGVLVLSEHTGAHEQLEPGVLTVSPLDVYGTAEALHAALTMSQVEREVRAGRLRSLIEQGDIASWLCAQLQAVAELGL